MFDVLVSAGATRAACELFWDVFFSSRGRGVSLRAHFPWLEDSLKVTCLEIRDPARPDKAVAALVIRAIDLPSEESIGLIGLVCVEEAWRGGGLSAQLISNASCHAEQAGLRALILWTQTPGVYDRHGFSVDEQDLTGRIISPPGRACIVECVREAWPAPGDYSDKRGLPPFASSGQRITGEGAELILVKSASLMTLVEWRGATAAVADLIESTISDTWILNVCASDPLIAELNKRRFKVDLVPGATRMIKWLRGGPLTLPPIKLIDRI